MKPYYSTYYSNDNTGDESSSRRQIKTILGCLQRIHKYDPDIPTYNQRDDEIRITRSVDGDRAVFIKG